ncbi:8216_t:CDS:1, partial [Rhizophagus irregularis]
PSTLSINNNTPTIFININNDEENLHNNDENGLPSDCEIDLFTAINKVSSEIQKINEQLEENLENKKIFNNCYSQIQLLDKITVMSILNGGN